MASVLELLNVQRSVQVGDISVDVYGVSSIAIAQLMARFPEFGKMFSGVEVDRAEMLKMAPDALAAFLAAGCGKPNDPAAESACARLGVGPQVDLVDEILRLTFPRGIGPFVAKLRGLGILAAGGEAQLVRALREASLSSNDTDTEIPSSSPQDKSTSTSKVNDTSTPRDNSETSPLEASQPKVQDGPSATA